MPLSRSVGPDGDLFLELPADSPAVRASAHAQDDELTAVLEITDVAPVSVPHRIRGRVRVSGRTEGASTHASSSPSRCAM